MAKLTIFLFILLSVYGTQAGIMTTMVGLTESNIVGLANQLGAMWTELENAAGYSIDDLNENVSAMFSAYEEEITRAMSENSISDVCSKRLTELREARNSTVNTAVANIQSMIEIAKSDFLTAKNMFDVIMIAMDNGETKVMECLGDLWYSIPCFSKVRTTVVSTITSNLSTFITSMTELTANQAMMTANIASTQLNAMNDLNSILNKMYQVLQQCGVDPSNTTN